MYGFLVFVSKEFSDTESLKMLYFSFVWFKLECASIIWNPHYQIDRDKLESVQRKKCYDREKTTTNSNLLRKGETFT